jgi:hypothetical protein
MEREIIIPDPRVLAVAVSVIIFLGAGWLHAAAAAVL